MGGAFMKRIKAIIKGNPENSLIPSAMWGHSEKMADYESGRRSLPHNTTAGALPQTF